MSKCRNVKISKCEGGLTSPNSGQAVSVLDGKESEVLCVVSQVITKIKYFKFSDCSELF